MERKSYITKWTFAHYLFASIVTMAVININGMLDGIVMGRVIGPNGLSAINVCMPVISGINAISILLTNGVVNIMAKALGAGKQDTVNEEFSVCIVSLIVCGILAGVISYGIKSPLAMSLSVDTSLLNYVEDYSGVLINFSVILILQNSLSMIVDVFGHPRVVTFSMTMSVVVNLFCDILYAYVWGMGIKGAAYATITGAIVSIAIFVIFLVKKMDKLHFVINAKTFFAMLGQNVLKGIPGVIGTLSTALMMLVCNSLIQKALGADGMFVMSICYVFISLGTMIASGVGMAYTGIGGMLVGEKDYMGLKILYKKGRVVVLGVVVLVAIILTVFPGLLATLFGSITQNQVDLAKSCLPMCIGMVFPMCFVTILSAIYQILEHYAAATIDSVMMLISVILSFIVSYILWPGSIFVAMIIAGIMIIFSQLVICFIIKRTTEEKVDFLSLIPEASGDAMCVSVKCALEAVGEELEVVKKYLDNNGLTEYTDRAIHSIEEISCGIVCRAVKGAEHYFDLVISKDSREMVVVIKDNGPKFDPMDINNVSMDITIAKHYCDSMDYSFQFGLNILTMKWNLNK